MKKTIKIFMMSICTMAVLTESAWAYLDPGTGSLILQSLIAGIAGAMVVIRLYWEKLKLYVTRIFSSDVANASRQRPEHSAAERDSELR